MIKVIHIIIIIIIVISTRVILKIKSWFLIENLFQNLHLVVDRRNHLDNYSYYDCILHHDYLDYYSYFLRLDYLNYIHRHHDVQKILLDYYCLKDHLNAKRELLLSSKIRIFSITYTTTITTTWCWSTSWWRTIITIHWIVSSKGTKIILI